MNQFGNSGYPGGGGGYPNPAQIGFVHPGVPPDGPPPGYSYPPVPVPVTPEQPIMTQPTGAHFPVHYGQPVVQFQPVMGHPGYNLQTQVVPLNVPYGLECLVSLDRLFVKQKVELLEALLGCETKNKFKVKNSSGQQILYAEEFTNCIVRNCFGRHRPFEIKVKDSSERNVLVISSPCGCDSCWFPCCLKKLEVHTAEGTLCGIVEQQFSICTPKFTIRDSSNTSVLKISGPFCTYSICGKDVEFQVLSKEGATQVGKISKSWSGLAREAFTDADNFGISFPVDLDVKMKAVMLGATFLIDFMFFEKTGGLEDDTPGMF